MRRMILYAPLLGAGGCEYLSEQRAAVTEVTMAGYVLASPIDGELLMESGEMTWMDAAGETLAEGPMSEGNAGYWSVGALPPSAPFLLRVDGGEGYHPTLSGGVTPAGNGLWFTGAVFGWSAALTDAFFQDTAAIAGLVGFLLLWRRP